MPSMYPVLFLAAFLWSAIAVYCVPACFRVYVRQACQFDSNRVQGFLASALFLALNIRKLFVDERLDESFSVITVASVFVALLVLRIFIVQGKGPRLASS